MSDEWLEVQDDAGGDAADAFAGADADDEGWRDVDAAVAPSRHAEHLEIKDWTGILPAPRFYIVLFLFALLAVGAALVWVQVSTLYGIASAGAALLLAIYVVVSWTMTRAATRRVYIEAHRTVSPERVQQGEVVAVTFDASATTVAYPMRVRIRDDPGPAFHPMPRPIMKRPGTTTYQARAQQRGDLVMPGFEVLLQDRRRLWRQTRTYVLASTVTVDPGMDGLWLRRYLTGQAAFGDEAPTAMVHLFREMEQEVTREYQPGDRMKDVDWKRVSITGQMTVRERRSISEDVVLLVVDASTSMTIGKAGVRNLDRALEIAREIVQEGNRRNLGVGYLAFDDRHLLDELAVSRARAMPRTLDDHFVRLGDPARLDREEDERLHDMKGQSMDVVLQHAMRQGPPGRMAILFFTDLDSAPEAVVQTLSRAASKGYRIGTFLFPPPHPQVKKVTWSHGVRPPGGYRGKKTRKALRELMTGHGVEFWDLRYRYEDAA